MDGAGVPGYGRRGTDSIAQGAAEHLRSGEARRLDEARASLVFDGWEGPHFVPAENERWRWPVFRAETWHMRQGVSRPRQADDHPALLTDGAWK